MSFIIARRASFKLCSIYSRGGGGEGGGEGEGEGEGGSNHWKRLPIKILSQLNLIELGKFNAVISQFSHTNVIVIRRADYRVKIILRIYVMMMI